MHEGLMDWLMIEPALEKDFRLERWSYRKWSKCDKQFNTLHFNLRGAKIFSTRWNVCEIWLYLLSYSAVLVCWWLLSFLIAVNLCLDENKRKVRNIDNITCNLYLNLWFITFRFWRVLTKCFLLAFLPKKLLLETFYHCLCYLSHLTCGMFTLPRHFDLRHCFLWLF